MKNVFKSMIAVVAVGSLFLGSCNKYEEGANLSLRSKKGRLAGTWTLEKLTYNGTDITSTVLPSGATWTTEIKKDGTWKSTYTYQSASDTDEGTWEFVEKKEQLKMVTNGSSDSDGDTSVIVTLKNKELKIRSGSGSDISEATYTQD